MSYACLHSNLLQTKYVCFNTLINNFVELGNNSTKKFPTNNITREIIRVLFPCLIN